MNPVKLNHLDYGQPGEHTGYAVGRSGATDRCDSATAARYARCPPVGGIPTATTLAFRSPQRTQSQSHLAAEAATLVLRTPSPTGKNVLGSSSIVRCPNSPLNLVHGTGRSMQNFGAKCGDQPDIRFGAGQSAQTRQHRFKMLA